MDLSSSEFGGLVKTYALSGKGLVELTATTDGNGMVRTFAPNGKELVALGASDNGGMVQVYNKTGEEPRERCRDALDLLKAKQFDDGTFPAERKHYRVGRIGKGNDSLVDWGGTNKQRTNFFVTCDALGVLRAAGERF